MNIATYSWKIKTPQTINWQIMDTKKLRQKVLDLAIHGKLVPQNPNDEPASMLLERIRAKKERLIAEGKIKRSRKAAKTSDMPHYENVPFEVPAGWVWTTLGEISNYGDCNNILVTDITDEEWILELEDLEKDTASIIQVLSKKERNIKGTRHKFQKGDILYSKLRTYLNKVLIAPQTGYCTTEIIPFNSFCGISTDYLCHVLRSTYFLSYTQQCGYGVKMPRLSTNDACKGMIPLPPFAEQQRIVAAIDRWFTLIEQIEQNKADLQTSIKQAKSKILDLAIHGKLVPQDHNDEPALELLKRINPKVEISCDNKHSEKLPKGWYLSTLGDCFKWGSGGTPESTVKAYYEGNIPWLVIGDLNDSIVTFASKHISQLGIHNSSAKVLTKGTLLMAMYGSIGKLGIAGMELATNQAIAYAKPNEINTYYLFYYLLANRDNFYMLGKGGTQKNISQTVIKSYPFQLPPLAEQKRIVQKIEELFSVIDTVEQTLQA